jgi:hypothetical protein
MERRRRCWTKNGMSYEDESANAALLEKRRRKSVVANQDSDDLKKVEQCTTKPLLAHARSLKVLGQSIDKGDQDGEVFHKSFEVGWVVDGRDVVEHLVA